MLTEWRSFRVISVWGWSTAGAPPANENGAQQQKGQRRDAGQARPLLVMYYSGENTLHSLSPRTKTARRNCSPVFITPRVSNISEMLQICIGDASFGSARPGSHLPHSHHAWDAAEGREKYSHSDRHPCTSCDVQFLDSKRSVSPTADCEAHFSTTTSR